MNNETCEKIIKVSNWNDKLYVVIETNDNSHNCYGNVMFGFGKLSFIDDNNKLIILNIKDVTGIKICDVKNTFSQTIKNKRQ